MLGEDNINSKIIFATFALLFLISLTCVSAADNQTLGDVVQECDNVTQEILTVNEGEGHFTDLNAKITNAGSEVELDRNYTYDADYADDVNYEDGIKIEKDNFVIDGKGFTINGANQARIFNIVGENVTIKNINFINGNSWNNGGTIYFNNSGTVDSSNFTNNYARIGAAIYLDGNGEVDISNCEFKSNTAAAGIIYYNQVSGRTVDFCKFTNNIMANTGAVIFYECGGTVKNSYFENNTADQGAGIFCSHDGIVENSTFISNKVQGGASCGPAIFFNDGCSRVDNCNFSNNQGFSAVFFNNAKGIVNNSNFNANMYGAIEFSSRDGGIVENCNFTNNIGFANGALYSNGETTVNNCSFINNTANQMGAAISINRRGNITNSNFINNTLIGSGGYGGAIRIEKDGFVDNCNFINNTGTSLGGAIYFGSNGFVNNSNFTNNIVNGTNELRGGAIYVFSSTAIIENCIFRANQAKNGGAVFFYNYGNITNCKFDSNVGQYGGAIYGIYTSGRGAVIIGSIFNNNSATEAGAIYYAPDYSGPANISITDSNFTNNKATKYGALYVKGELAVVTHCLFINNSASDRQVQLDWLVKMQQLTILLSLTILQKVAEQYTLKIMVAYLTQNSKTTGQQEMGDQFISIMKQMLKTAHSSMVKPITMGEQSTYPVNLK